MVEADQEEHEAGEHDQFERPATAAQREQREEGARSRRSGGRAEERVGDAAAVELADAETG